MDSPADSNDPGWRRLSLAAGVLLFLVVGGTLGDLVLGNLLGGDLTRLPPTAAARFAQLAERPWVGLYELDLLNLVLSTLSVPVYFALLGALRRTSLPLAGLSFALLVLSTAVFASANAALPMLELSGKYAASADPGQQAALLGAGEALLARGAHGSLGAFFGFAGSTLASLTMAAAMLSGGVFSRRVAVLGLVAFPLLLAYLVLVTFVPGARTVALAISAPGGILALVWECLVAARLVALGRRASC